MEESKSIGQQSPQITEHLSKTASTKATPGLEDTIEEVVQQVSLAESMEERENQPLQIQPDSEVEPKPEEFNLLPAVQIDELQEPVQEIFKSKWVLGSEQFNPVPLVQEPEPVLAQNDQPDQPEQFNLPQNEPESKDEPELDEFNQVQELEPVADVPQPE